MIHVCRRMRACTLCFQSCRKVHLQQTFKPPSLQHFCILWLIVAFFMHMGALDCPGDGKCQSVSHP